MDKVFEFAYTSCIHESAMACISLHKTKKGAETAMHLHKEEKRKEWVKHREWQIKEYGKDYRGLEFGEMEHWDVYERKIYE